MNEILLTKVETHNVIKDTLLDLINSQPSGPNDNTNDKVSRLDWYQSEDFTRKWVQYFMPHFNKTYQSLVDKLGYKTFDVRGIWYQQYEHNDVHEWHLHSDNYTGLYYLEMPNPVETQIYSNDEIIDLPVSEGDLVIFPGYRIHKEPNNVAKTRKTIISFNVNFEGIQEKLLTKIRKLEDERK